MVKVPKYDYQVSVGDVGGAISEPQLPTMPKESFGLGAASPQEGLSKVLDPVTKFFQQRAKQYQEMELRQNNNQLEVQYLSDLNNRLFGEGEETIMRDGEKVNVPFGLLNREGVSSRGIIKQYREYVNSQMAGYAGMVSDPEMRAKLMDRLADYSFQRESEVIKHQVKQDAVYKKNSSDSKIETLIDEAGITNNMNDLLGEIDNEVKETGRYLGEPEGAIRIASNEKKKQAVNNKISALLIEDPTGKTARDMLVTVKDMLGKDDYIDLRDRIETRKKQIEATNESIKKEERINNRFDFVLSTLGGEIDWSNVDKRLSSIAKDDPDLAQVINKLVSSDFMFLPEQGGAQEKLAKMQFVEVIGDIYDTNDREEISNFVLEFLKSADGENVSRDHLSMLIVSAKMHADAQLDEATAQEKQDDVTIRGVVEHIQSLIPITSQMQTFFNFLKKSQGKTGDALKEAGMDTIIEEKIKQEPSLSVLPREQAIQKINVAQEQENQEKIAKNLEFDFSQLNPFDVKEAEASDQAFQQRYETLSPDKKAMSGAIANRLVDIMSAGMSLEEADDFYNAMNEGGNEIPQDIINATTWLMGILSEAPIEGGRFMSDPIGFANKELNKMDDKELLAKMREFPEGKIASLKLLGRVIEPIGRMFGLYRGALKEGIEQVIDEEKEFSVGEMVKHGIRGFLKPEEIKSIISMIPLTAFEREGTTKIGSIARLTPRAVAEAIEVMVLARMIFHLPSKVKDIKEYPQQLNKQNYNKALDKVQNDYTSAQYGMGYLKSRGVNFRTMETQEKFHDVWKRSVAELRTRANNKPEELTKLLQKEMTFPGGVKYTPTTWSKILTNKLVSESGQAKFISDSLAKGNPLKETLTSALNGTYQIASEQIIQLNNAIINSKAPKIIKKELIKANSDPNRFMPITQAEYDAQVYLVNNFEKAKKDYLKLIKKEFSGADNVVSTDVGRFVYKGMKASMSPSFQEPGSAISKAVKAELEADPKLKGKPAGTLAGGSGSGKTTILKEVLASKKTSIKDEYAYLWDTNTNKIESAEKKLLEAIDKGRAYQITYVYRDPIQAWVNGVIPRVASQDRIVPIQAHIETHQGSYEVMKHLSDKYKNNSNVLFTYIDNSFSKGMSKRLLTLDKVPKFDYTDIGNKLFELTKEALEDGKITQEQFRATLEGSPELQKLAEKAEVRPVGVGEGRAGATEEGGQTLAVAQPKQLRASKLVEVSEKGANRVFESGGATIDVYTGKEPKEGFVFSESKNIETKIPESEFKESHVLEFISEHQDDFIPNETYLGLWIEDGVIYEDVVTISLDKADALARANANEQLAIYDLATGETTQTDFGRSVENAKRTYDSGRPEKLEQGASAKLGQEGKVGSQKAVEGEGKEVGFGRFDEEVPYAVTSLREAKELAQKVGGKPEKIVGHNIWYVASKTDPEKYLTQEGHRALIFSKEPSTQESLRLSNLEKLTKPVEGERGSIDLTEPPDEATINLERMKVSEEAKQKITEASQTISDKVEKVTGKPLSHEEVVEKAKDVEILTKGVSREKTLEFEAALLKTRQHLGALAEQRELTQEFLDTLQTVSNIGTDIARQLESFKIEALPEYAIQKTKIIKEILRLGNSAEEVLEKAKGVDFKDPNQVADFYREFVKPKFIDELNEFAYMNILSSPKTHIINTFSNLIQTVGLNPLTRLSSGLYDSVASGLTGKAREAYVNEIPKFYHGMFNAVPEAIDQVNQIMKGKLFVERPDIKHIPTKSKWIDKATLGIGKYIPRALEAMDVYFRTLIKAGEMEALASRYPQPLSPTDMKEVEAEASRRAEYYVFRAPIDPENRTGQGDLLSAIDKLTKAVYGFRQVPGVQWFVRFVRTPMNILRQGLEYSPAGIGTIKGAKAKSEQAGKAILGSAVFAGAMALANAGRTTWGVPRGENERKMFYQAGMQPYSIKIGDRWYAYSRVGPLAYPIAMAAAIHYHANESKTALSDSELEKATKALAGVMRFFSDQSYLEGIGQLVGTLQGEQFEQTKAFTNVPTQLISLVSLQRWMNQIIDPVYRDPERGVNVEALKQNLMNSIIGLSVFLPEKEGIYGEPAEREDRIINAISPVMTRKEKENVAKMFRAERKLLQEERAIDKSIEEQIKEMKRRMKKKRRKK